ncbi:Glycosyl hydrolase 5 family protein [Glycine soja]|nr:Glycosyl hydrolase 5 family protein [Glycine soja]
MGVCERKRKKKGNYSDDVDSNSVEKVVAMWERRLSLKLLLAALNGKESAVAMCKFCRLMGTTTGELLLNRYMVKGAEAVHAANPDVLVILSGLNFDTSLSFIRDRPVSLTFKGKLVFEVHRYGFTDGGAWADGNPNQVYGKVTADIKQTSTFLVDQGWPLFVSEFGGDLRGTNVNGNRYLNCFLALVAELDLDWAYWTLVGSYYFREGVIGMEEFYGLLTWDWTQITRVWILSVYGNLWHESQRVRKRLQMQGIKGPPPYFLRGNLPNMQRIQSQAKAASTCNSNHSD